jgi:3-hydroxy-9,10-secoandrosta-1,3,5(10)-triene-9,17-dione monooxygenase
MTVLGREGAIKGDLTHAERYRECCDRARSLIPVLEQRAAMAEELRQLPPQTVEDFHAAGLFRVLQPLSVGGSELNYSALVDISAILARGCASSAWNFTNLASHHWMLAMFPEAAQDSIWPDDPDTLIASSFIFPAGKARRVPGGYRLSGRWAFSSGIDASTWNMLAGVVEGGDDPPDHRVFLLPRSDYRAADTWYASGLKGTGSNDVACDDVFVAEEMSVSASDLKGGPTPGSSRNSAALYTLPVFALFPLILSGVGLGVAEAAFAGYVGAIRERSSRYSGAKLSELHSTQIRIGNAGTRIDVARGTMLAICTKSMEDAQQGYVPDFQTKMRYRRDTAFATNLCVEAVDMVCAGTGAQALYLNNPLQRHFRVAHAVAAHVAFSMDAAAAAFGRAALGFDDSHPTI